MLLLASSAVFVQNIRYKSCDRTLIFETPSPVPTDGGGDDDDGRRKKRGPVGYLTALSKANWRS